MNAVTTRGSVPAGPDQPYDPSQDLLSWMQLNFEAFGDIYKASIYGGDVYVISSPEYAEHVLLGNWQNYLRKGQAVKRIALSLGNGLISSNGDFWIRQRRMMQPAFRREAVGSLLDVFVKPNVALREKWLRAARTGATCEVTRDVSETVLEVTLRSIFGSDHDKFAGHFTVIAEESRNLEFAQTCSALSQIIMQTIRERRVAQVDANDILGQMMRARDREGQAMPDAQMAREGLTLVIAGHETTASVLNWMWYLLARYSEVQARVVHEIHALHADRTPDIDSLSRFKYTRQFIEEALRSYPPLWLMTRKAINTDWLGNYLVPKGTEIYISPYLLQRHPRFWVQPDRFDPDRFDPDRSASEDSRDSHRLAMCPFGAGPRNCIGEFFARVEMQVHLLTILPHLELQYPSQKSAEFVAGVNLLSRDHFIMVPVVRKAFTD